MISRELTGQGRERSRSMDCSERCTIEGIDTRGAYQPNLRHGAVFEDFKDNRYPTLLAQARRLWNYGVPVAAHRINNPGEVRPEVHALRIGKYQGSFGGEIGVEIL